MQCPLRPRLWPPAPPPCSKHAGRAVFLNWHLICPLELGEGCAWSYPNKGDWEVKLIWGRIMKHWPPHSAMLVLFPNKIGFCSFSDKRDSPDMTWKSMRNEAGLRRSGQWWTDGERQMISRLVLCKYFRDYASTEKINKTWPGSTTRAIDWQLLEHETREKSRKQHTVFCQTEYIFLLPMSVFNFRRGTVLCGEPIGQSEKSIGSDWPMRSRHNGMLDIDKPAEVDNLGLCLSLTMWEYTQETIDLPSIIQTTT